MGPHPGRQPQGLLPGRQGFPAFDEDPQWRKHSQRHIDFSRAGFPRRIAYCPSKYAIEGLTQCMALELRPYNIAANSLNVSSVEGKQLKPTGLTLEEAARLPESVKGRYVDYDDLANAYADAWAFLALQRGNGVTGQRFRTKDLAAMLRSEGQESVLKKFKGKLTKATYVPIEFPKVSRYQTPGGGFKEIAY